MKRQKIIEIVFPEPFAMSLLSQFDRSQKMRDYQFLTVSEGNIVMEFPVIAHTAINDWNLTKVFPCLWLDIFWQAHTKQTPIPTNKFYIRIKLTLFQ